VWRAATSGPAGAGAAAAALDSHRLAFNSKVCRRHASAAIDERELERLAVGEVGETCLLDRRNMDEYVFTAVIADDEAEALLRIEEFYDAFAFADDLGRHSATAPAAAAAAEAATATAEATATAAAEAAAIAVATAASAAESTASGAAAVAAALLVAKFAELLLFAAEIIAFIATAAAAIALAPSIETHEPSEI
jgi:hypothetical protein